jgi:hypothetical protein
MNKTLTFLKPREFARRLESEDNAAECYRRVDLAPSTLETLVTWDVSVHARREQDRLGAMCRMPGTIQVGY